jgi:pimeloyl-ACP methyl ester carboxylesterase
MTGKRSSSTYRVRRTCSVEHLTLRGNVRYAIRRWGTPSQATAQRPTLLLTHGWMDVGASFQFMVDHLVEDRQVIALDWRGFGQSTGPAPTDSYWFPDYLGDLDALVDQIAPEAPIDLLGHSMGGNIVMSYAALRPARIRKLVNLEGFGMPEMSSDAAPGRLVRWLDELKVPQALRSFADLEQVTNQLVKNNPRLDAERAAWLAAHWARPGSDGRWHVLGDPAHKRVNPVLYRRDEVLACWRAIQAPVLWVEGSDTQVLVRWGDSYPRNELETRLATVGSLQRVMLDECGHMVHLDRPEALARVVEEFLAS